MASKPRTTRSKRAKNQPTANNTNSEEPGYIGSAFNAVSSLSVPQKIGLGVSALALLSTAALRLSGSKKKSRGKGKTKGKSLKDPKSRDFAEISWNAKSKPKRDKTEKIPTAQVTKAFQTCLSSKRPQQQLIADQFYEEIKRWDSQQLDVDGQTIVVNFLFWYYRSMNVPETKFNSEQAEHIRYWADYALTSDIKWDYYNIKFDYMYSTALLQRSIPHMKKFYRWVQSETPRAAPDDASSRKPNYYLTKYQAACILGDWQNGVKQSGQIIKDMSSKATSVNATRSDYFMHYTLRALELPASNPNFGLMYKIVDKLIAEFPVNESPPPIFTSWNILSFRYRNVEENQSYLQDQDFIFASDKIKDEDGFYKFYPQNNTMTARLNKKINIWGRVCQMVSPVFGAAGFLPLTGSWNDTKVYMETNWTFRGSGNRLNRKHVIMRMERLPIEQEIESKDFFGKEKKEKGYIWKGHITVHMKKLPKGMTIKHLYDNEGEDYFDGEKAIKEKQLRQKEQKEKPVVTKTEEVVSGNGTIVNNENGDNDNDKDKDESDKKESIEVETQIYEVEMVMNNDDPMDKDKELKKRILSAMNPSPSTTPR